MIQNLENQVSTFEVSVSTLSGKKLFTWTGTNFESIPIKDKIIPGVYILIIKDQNSGIAVQKKLIVF